MSDDDDISMNVEISPTTSAEASAFATRTTTYNCHQKRFSQIIQQYPPPNAKTWSSLNIKNHPRDSANILSIILLTYMFPLLMKGYKKPLELEDLQLPPKMHQLQNLYEHFIRTYVRCEETPADGEEREFNFTFNVFRSLLHLNKWYLIFGTISQILQTWIGIASVLMFRQLIIFLYTDEDESQVYKGILFACGIAVCQLLASICGSRCWVFAEEAGIGARNLIMGLLFRKILRIPGYAFNSAGKKDRKKKNKRGTLNIGEVVNTMSNDSNRIYFMFRMGTSVPAAIINVPTIVAIMVVVVGFESFIGFAVMAFLAIANTIIGLCFYCFFFCKHMSWIRKQHESTQNTSKNVLLNIGKYMAVMKKRALKITDERVKFLSEMLSGIRVLKMYAWETPLQSVIHEIRTREISSISHLYKLYAVLMTILFNTHHITIVSVLAMKYALGKKVDVSSVYVVIQFVNVLRISLVRMSFITYIIDGWVAMGRVQKLMNVTDHHRHKKSSGIKVENKKPFISHDHYPRTTVQKSATDVEVVVKQPLMSNAELKDESEDEEKKVDNISLPQNSNRNNPLLIRLKNASFQHEPNSTINMLKNVSIDIHTNELICVIGSVGSGKSTFIKSLLNETHYHPSVSDKSVFECYNNNMSIAYIGHTLFVMNGTIRDNIIMHLEFNEEAYDTVIEACALVYDLRLFPAGDSTEIGEKGINLSGGQKVRICIARAFYQHLHHSFDILLFDDTLSALDNNIAKHIFHKGILKLVAGKSDVNTTIIIVLNSHLHFVNYFDRVLVMQYLDAKANGNLGNDSGYCTLADDFYCKNESENLKLLKDKYYTLIPQIEKELMVKNTENGDEIANGNKPPENEIFSIKVFQQQKAEELGEDFETVAKLVNEEQRDRGRISDNSFIKYLDGAYPGYGIFIFFCLFMFYLFTQIIWVSFDIWISWWSARNSPHRNARWNSPAFIFDDQNLSNYYWMIGCWIFLCSVLIFSYLRISFFYMVCVASSKTFEQVILQRMLHAPIAYFDRTPAGRIINRFSFDLTIIDNQLPRILQLFGSKVAIFISYFIVISIFLPWYMLGKCLS